MSIFEQPLVFVDIETNGLNHIRGRVIEVAAIRVENGEVAQEFQQLIDPGSPLPQFITQLTGITETDLADAPLFMAIADELYDILDGAIFVAHNVRFDYSFLKQEFHRIGKHFSPRQLCTVKLSRALFPEQRTHKLQALIERHNLRVVERHRAYDDAHALWQFMQLMNETFDAAVLEKVIARQLKKPSLPKGLDPSLVAQLPEGPGVYILEDAAGNPLYIGKSVTIKKRVLSHFMHDHGSVSEFKIAQQVRHIATHTTTGELEALLLESQLIKQLQPVHNKRLRHTEKLLLAKHILDKHGYGTVRLEEASSVQLEDVPHILAIYPRRSKARDSLDRLAKEWQLCPKLLGIEKARQSCFSYQLKRCGGACVQKEIPAQYNARLHDAFRGVRIESWPYKSPVLIQEKLLSDSYHGIIVDQWCVIGEVSQADDTSQPEITTYPRTFDLDAYAILRSHLKTKIRQLSVRPISLQALQQQFEVAV